MPEATTAPAAPATTQPTTTAAPPAADRSPADFMSQELADFAEMDKAPEAQPGAARSRDDKGKFAKTAETTPAKPADKPADEVTKPEGETTTKPADTTAPKSPMRTLGERYDTLRKEVDTTYKPTIQRLEARVKELETAAASPELNEQVNQWKARAERAEKTLEVEAYTKSQAYQEQFEKPYIDQWHRTVSQFKELSVKVPKGSDEMGQPIFDTRPADETDLLRLANLKLSEMDDEVTKLFGASAPRVITSIEKLRELAAARRNAAMNAEEKAAAARKTSAAESETKIKTLAHAWQEVNKALEQKFPKAFKPEENNTEDAAAHSRGFALGDLLFVGEAGLRPDQIEALPELFKETIKAKQPLSDAQRVQLHALARLKIANHDRQLARVKKLQARVAELEKDLAAYEKSEPGGRPSSRETKPGDGKDWLATAEDELRALDK